MSVGRAHRMTSSTRSGTTAYEWANPDGEALRHSKTSRSQRLAKVAAVAGGGQGRWIVQKYSYRRPVRGIVSQIRMEIAAPGLPSAKSSPLKLSPPATDAGEIRPIDATRPVLGIPKIWPVPSQRLTPAAGARITEASHREYRYCVCHSPLPQAGERGRSVGLGTPNRSVDDVRSGGRL